ALNMNPFDQLLWAAFSLVVVGALARERPPNGVALGVLAGAGLMNKHSFAFFLVAAVVGLALSPQRRLLSAPGSWLAAAIAAALVAPNLAWEVHHHWPTLEFLRNAAANKNYS